MRDFFTWFAQQGHLHNKPWLILGKGPSLSKLTEEDANAYPLLGLNHVVRDRSVLVAHVIDLEVIEQCGERILANAGVLVMPWIPHERYRPISLSRSVSFKPSNLDLHSHAERNPILKALRREGRLLWYNLSTAGRERVRPGSAVVPVFGFSATAALNLLAMAGVQRVRSLGVDGGTGYSRQFQDLRTQTMLVAGQANYDAQFREFARTIMTTRVDFAPLDIESPIQVYVGAEPEQRLPMRVLEYSIRKHCSMSVQVTSLSEAVRDNGIMIPVPRSRTQRARTPFSFQRFSIPEIRKFKGRAIYLDSDMLVFRDLRELWTWPFDNADVLSVREPEGTGRASQFSVMVLNCDVLRWEVADIIRGLDEGRWNYEQLVFGMAAASNVHQTLPAGWNDLERYDRRTTALTHFTDMDTQPWLATDSMLGRIWCEVLLEAVDQGFIKKDEVMEDIDRGWIRPSLQFQLENSIVDPLLLPERVRRTDAMTFVAPHRVRGITKGITGFGRPPTTFENYARRGYAISRDVWFRSRGDVLMRKIRNRLTAFFG